MGLLKVASLTESISCEDLCELSMLSALILMSSADDISASTLVPSGAMAQCLLNDNREQTLR